MGKEGRKANGEGSVYKRKDGRYEARITVETPNGPKRLTKTTKKRKDADRWLTDTKTDHHRGELPDPEVERLTVAEYLEDWHASCVEGVVGRHTSKDHEGNIRRYIAPAIGHVKLQKLTAGQLQKLYGQMRRDGYAPRTIRYVHTTISKALSQAEAWDYVRKNVARHAQPPKLEQSERRTLTVPETKQLFEAAAGDRLEALYVLALTTGMRRGELLGLKWPDLDLEHKALRVSRSLDTYYGPPAENAPKTRSGQRAIALMPEALEALRVHRARQAEERLAAGSGWREHGLVFPTPIGTPQSGDNVRNRSLYPLLERAGLPRVTFHELRHTFATFQLANNERPKVVQEILGHSSIKQTMDTYSHVIPGMQEESSERLRGLLFGPSEHSTAGTQQAEEVEARS